MNQRSAVEVQQRVFAKGSAGFVSLEDVRQEVIRGLSVEDQQKIATELAVDTSLVPPHLRVPCRFGGCTGACKSSAKNAGWVCGDRFSHFDRLERCVAYIRLDKGWLDGESVLDKKKPWRRR